MRTMHTIKIISVLLLIPACIHGFTLTGLTFFSPRSQSTNAARDLVGWHPYINLCCKEKVYGAVEITPEYGQSVRAHRIANALFSTQTLRISGSEVANREEDDLLADFFGLSPSFDSTINLDPNIKTFQTDFGAYIGWNNFYFRFHAPAVWTRWQLSIYEEVADNGAGTPFPAGYMDVNAVQAPVQSFSQAICCPVSFGQVHTPMKYGTFGCPQTLSGLSDLQMALGWNFVNSEDGRAGLNLRVTAPTGSRPTSRVLFEPIVGNGKHWEVGLGFSSQVMLWEKDNKQAVTFFADMNGMTLLKTLQHRAFDFTVNGWGSRYELLKEFDDSGNYTGNLVPAINVTTLPVNLGTAFQLDFAAMIGYTYNRVVIDLGYNLWLRTHENISLRSGIPSNRYALKGIQNVATDPGGLPLITTQSTSLITGDQLSEQAAVVDIDSPVFIDTCSLDLTTAVSPLVMTQKIFGHIGYAWKNWYDDGAAPYLGIGAEMEFEGINVRATEIQDKNTLSQWNVWIRGGWSF